jgi:hypothetical protein
VPKLGQTVSGPGFEPGTSPIRIISDDHYTTLLNIVIREYYTRSADNSYKKLGVHGIRFGNHQIKFDRKQFC